MIDNENEIVDNSANVDNSQETNTSETANVNEIMASAEVAVEATSNNSNEEDSITQDIEVLDEDNEDSSQLDAIRINDSNAYIRSMMDGYFLEYAAYVIKDRAIPDVDDGFKPVQRRILWVLHKIDDGRTHKAANVVGTTMQYHPHGDASIGDALVVLANKEYFIKKQGNFGNIITGSSAAAPRYIECSLSQLGREVLFSDEITELVDSYDGRSQEPTVLPVKIPSLLMGGSDGIAVGMATKIMPHNFNELLQAQISALKGEDFELYPDFLQGGLMDAREYDDGNGKITLRAKIEIDGRQLVIREIPATTTTESLIASIEKAADKNKIKVSSVDDFTSKNVEIRIIPTRGYDPEKTLQALYMYTDCAVSISVNMTVIKDRKPTQMTVHQVIYRNTEKLLEYLNKELENDYLRLFEQFHAKTLAQIFFEYRIYKRIEECRSEEEEYKEVYAGLEPFTHYLGREITDPDIDKLLALPVRKISRFDIEKNQTEMREILNKMKKIRKNITHLSEYAIEYLENLLKKYGHLYPRRTEIEHFDRIDRNKAALNNIKIGWEKKTGYIGTAIKSDDTVVCNEFDRFILAKKSGEYKVITLPGDKLFVGKLYDFRRLTPELCYGVIYKEKKTGKYYGKRSVIGGYRLNTDYMLCPEDCQLELLTPRADAIYKIIEKDGRGTITEREINLFEFPLRSPKARGLLLTAKAIQKITHQRYLTEEELEALKNATIEDTEAEGVEELEAEDIDNAEVVEDEVVKKIKPVTLKAQRRVLPTIPEMLPSELIPNNNPKASITSPEAIEENTIVEENNSAEASPAETEAVEDATPVEENNSSVVEEAAPVETPVEAEVVDAEVIEEVTKKKKSSKSAVKKSDDVSSNTSDAENNVDTVENKIEDIQNEVSNIVSIEEVSQDETMAENEQCSTSQPEVEEPIVNNVEVVATPDEKTVEASNNETKEEAIPTEEVITQTPVVEDKQNNSDVTENTQVVIDVDEAKEDSPKDTTPSNVISLEELVESSSIDEKVEPKKPTRKPSILSKDEDEDFGIVQPEFGF